MNQSEKPETPDSVEPGYFVKWRSAKPWLQVVEDLVAELNISAELHVDDDDGKGDTRGKVAAVDRRDGDFLTWGSLKPYLEKLRKLSERLGVADHDSGGEAVETDVEKRGTGGQADDPGGYPDNWLVKWRSFKPVVELVDRVDFDSGGQSS